MENKAKKRKPKEMTEKEQIQIAARVGGFLCMAAGFITWLVMGLQTAFGMTQSEGDSFIVVRGIFWLISAIFFMYR